MKLTLVSSHRNFISSIATPTIHTNNVTVLEGKHAVLRCIGTNQTQSYTISWLREGRELHSDANTGQTKLTFYSVNRRHAGTYECKITIGQVKISAYPRLTVVCKHRVQFSYRMHVCSTSFCVLS